MSDAFTMRLDLSAFDADMDRSAEEMDKAARPASQAAAQVYYNAARQNVSKLRSYTGNLASAIYQVFSKDQSNPSRAVYHVSWNARKAPHGHLVEHGYLRRYRYYKGADGQVRPMVRPGMDGRPRPGRRASQAEKNAYYVTLPTPEHVPGKFFLRNAASKKDEAIQAATQVLLRALRGES